MKPIVLAVIVLAATAAFGGAAKRKASAPAAAPIKAGGPLADLVAKLGASVRTDDVEAAKAYRLAPEFVGVVPKGSAGRVLGYLVGSGWDGSKLPAAQRQAGGNYQLARMPHVYEFSGARYFVCNNRAWDWTTEGRQVVVYRRVKADGDLTVSKSVRFDKLEDDLTLGTMLDEIQRQTGATVTNIFGEQHVPTKASGLLGKAQELELPMTAISIPGPLRDRLTQGATVGEALSILCIGLNRHTQSRSGDWKWSSAYEGGKLIYTLRDYAHLFTP